MRQALTTFAAIAFVAGLAGSAAAAPVMDATGKCRDSGKFVKASMCAAKPAAAGKCRDMKTKKFAKCGTAGTEPAPMKK